MRKNQLDLQLQQIKIKDHHHLVRNKTLQLLQNNYFFAQIKEVKKEYK